MDRRIFCVFLMVVLNGCPLDGDSGNTGAAGSDGINCWDLNENHLNDPEEDINGDSAWDVQDCSSQRQAIQNPDVELNHQHICEAFANLGQYPEGCPSAVHSNPPGTLQKINALLDSGSGYAVSCDFEPNNGVLSVYPKNGVYYWVVDGGYIANATTLDAVDELTNDTCFNTCVADPRCIASWATSELDPPVTAYTCHHFYHSDTITQWERRCSVDINNCTQAQGALSQSDQWGALCP